MTFPVARHRRRVLPARALALAIGAVLPGSALAQEGAAAVQDVTLTDVTFPIGTTTVKIPKLVASGTRLSREDLAGIFRADSPEPWAARLARLDASSLTAPVLQADDSGPRDSRQSTTYRELVARDVRAGKVGELTAAGATLTITVPGPAGNGAGTYGALRATDLDLGAFAGLAAEPGDGKGPPRRIYGSLQISDVAFSYERGTTVKIARIEGREIGARPVPKGWSGALDALAGSDDPAKRRDAYAAAADLLGALALGSLDLHGLSVSESASGPPVLTEIGRIAYAATGPEAGLTIEDITTSGVTARTHLGKITLTGSSLAPFVAALRRKAQDPDGSLDVGMMRQISAGFGTLTLTDLAADLPPDPPVMKRGAAEMPQKDARIETKPAMRTKLVEGRQGEPNAADPLSKAATKPHRITLREGVLGPGPAAAAGGPGSTRLTLTDLGIPASLVDGMPLIGALQAYGYGDLNFDVAADAAWDEAARTVDLRDVTLAGKDIGRIKLSALFGGIGPELFSGSVPAQTMLMFSGNARNAELTVENGGLFERFLAAQAKELSLKPDELRKEYVTASVLGVPVILGNGPAAKEIGAAMGQFVVNPNKLTVRAKAKEPTGVGFIELGTARSPAAVLDRLDIEARAN